MVQQVLDRSGVPVSAPTLQALLERLLVPIRHIGPTLKQTCVAAVAYTAGDVMSQSATDNVGVPIYVPNLARTPGGTATIMSVRVRCTGPSVLNSLRLYFFKTIPQPADVEMDDNIPFSLKTVIGVDNLVGNILLNSFIAGGTAGATSDTDTINAGLACAPTDTGLWMVITTATAEANQAANMVLSFDIYVA